MLAGWRELQGPHGFRAPEYLSLVNMGGGPTSLILESNYNCWVFQAGSIRIFARGSGSKTKPKMIAHSPGCSTLQGTSRSHVSPIYSGFLGLLAYIILYAQKLINDDPLPVGPGTKDFPFSY